jgi:hypothetical protein
MMKVKTELKMQSEQNWQQLLGVDLISQYTLKGKNNTSSCALP